MLQYALLLVFAGAAISLVCLVLLCRQHPVKVKRRVSEENLPHEFEETPLVSDAADKELVNEGKTDERLLEAGDSEAERPLINGEDRKYYQELGDKQKQDEAIELLLRMSRENEQKQEIDLHAAQHRQEQKKQNDKNAENKRQLNKITNLKMKRKVAKKVAKKNLQLDDEQIKRIKLKALGGRMK